ncbi:MAG: hypothetical protein ABSC94_05900 [Polyangiaceae bacterium]
MTSPDVAKGQKAPPPIVNNSYSLDLFQGPVTTAARVIGLAGAYAGLAEGCEGEYSNAAAPAVRTPYSLGKWDYDVALGFTNPGAFKGSDFENLGPQYTSLPTRFSNSVTLNAGLEVQFDSVGITVDVDELRFGVQGPAAALAQSDMVINRVTASIANAFLDDQLILGVGFRAMTFGLNQQIDGALQGFLSGAGANSQFGGILKPRNAPFRIGATLRPEITVGSIQGTAASPGGVQVADNKILPSTIVMPWEVEAGGVVELGRRPLNPPRADLSYAEQEIRARYDERRLERAAGYKEELRAAPDTAREALRRRLELDELALEAHENREINEKIARIVASQKALAELWDRRQMLLVFGVLVTGPTANGVGLSDFLAQLRSPSGQSTVLSARLAFETEVIRNWVLLRGGTYLEPARYADTQSREHFTLGVDLRLFAFNPFHLFGDDPWQLRLASDGAARYFNWAVTLGKYR